MKRKRFKKIRARIEKFLGKIFKKKKFGILNFRFLPNIKRKIERIKAMERRKRFVVLGISVIFLFAAGFAVAGVIGGFSTGDINKGLVGHWPLDSAHLNSTTNRVDDISGHGNHGTNSGATLTTDRHGQANGAMDFDGSSVGCGNNESLDISDSLSVSAWVKFDSLDYSGSTGGLFSIGKKGSPDSPSPHSGWWFRYDNRNNANSFVYTCFGNTGGGYSGGGNNFDGHPQNTFLNGEWYHLAFTITQTEGKLYINGEQDGNTEEMNNLDLSASVSALSLGDGFKGSIQDVRIYNRALSQPEVKKLYETYKPKFSVGSADKGLIRHYSFDNFGEWTENLAPYVDYSNRTYEQAYTASSWGGDAATVYYYEDGGYNNLPYKRMIKTVAGTGGSYLDDNQYITIEDNKTYTISAWMKASRNQDFNGHLLNINRPADNVYRTGDIIVLTTEWKRYSWVYNSGTGHAGQYHTRHIIYIDNPPLEIYWSGFQVEEKSYTTPFVDGIRADYVRDNSGHTSHTILDSNTPKWIEEDELRKGSSEFFKGEEKRIRIPDPFLYTKTISFWVKVKEGEHTSGEAVPFLVYNDGVITTSGDSNQILLCMQSDKFRMHGWGSNDPLAITNINDGDWHHLIWHMNYHVSDPAQRLMNMWVDGVKEVSDYNYNQGSFGPVADSYWWVGYNSRSYSPYLRDSSILIDDIRFYDRVLSQTEVDVLYVKSRSGSSVGTSTTNLNKGLVGQWDLKSKSKGTGGIVNLAPHPFFDDATVGNYYDGTNSGWGSVTRMKIEQVTGPFGNTVKAFSEELLSYTVSPHMEGNQYQISGGGTNYTDLEVGSYYASAYFKATTEDSTSNLLYRQGASGSGSSPMGTVGTDWTRYGWQFDVTTPGTHYFRTYFYSVAVGFKVWMTGLEVIKGTEPQGLSDSTPYGNHGTIYGATVGDDYTTFDGSGDYVSMSNILNEKTEFTMVAWMKRSAAGTVVSLGETDGSGTRAEMLLYSNGNFYGEVGSNPSTYGTKAVVNDTNWHHTVMVFNGSGATNSDRLKLYFNGEQLENLTFSGTIAAATSCSEPFVIGYRYTGYSSGSVSNIKVYDRVLSPAEVKLLYDKGR